MKAWRLDDAGAGLVLAEVVQPKAGAGEILVQVRAAGVIRAELQWQPTTHTKTGEKRNHAVVGHEFSGTVAEVGDGVRGVNVGDEVYGMNDWYREGATAEYCVTRPEWVAAKPGRLTFAEAGAAPISALTAWQGLFEKAKLQAGERVLVQGGSGGVGTFAVQLARRAGARVVTTADGRNKDFLLGLGAERVIDYKTERFEESVKNVDVVFDTVGGETLEKSWGVLGPKGRLVTIVSDLPETADKRTKRAFFIVEAKREQLEKIGGMMEAGEIVVVVDAVVPFERAEEAYRGKVAGGAGRGKVVVEFEGEHKKIK